MTEPADPGKVEPFLGQVRCTPRSEDRGWEEIETVLEDFNDGISTDLIYTTVINILDDGWIDGNQFYFGDTNEWVFDNQVTFNGDIYVEGDQIYDEGTDTWNFDTTMQFDGDVYHGGDVYFENNKFYDSTSNQYQFDLDVYFGGNLFYDFSEDYWLFEGDTLCGQSGRNYSGTSVQLLGHDASGNCYWYDVSTC